MLHDWDKRFPGRVENIFNSLGRVNASHLLDRSLFDFAAVAATGVPTAGGDTAFDQEDFASFATVPVTLLATAQKADQPQ